METNFKKSTAKFGCYNDCKKQDRFIKTEDFTINDVFNARVSISDKFWFIRNNCELTDKQYREIAIGCALIVLPIYESKYSENKAPREAIEAAKYYLVGAIGIDILRQKRADAAAAAYAADTAAAYAAYAAAYAADAAYADTAYAAAAYATDAAAAAAVADYKELLLNFFIDFFKQ